MLNINDTKPPISSNYKVCRLWWNNYVFGKKPFDFLSFFSLALLYDAAWVNYRCSWLEDSNHMVGDLREALNVAARGAAGAQERREWICGCFFVALLTHSQLPEDVWNQRTLCILTRMARSVCVEC